MRLHKRRKSAAINPGVPAVNRVRVARQSLSVVIEAERVVVARHHVLPKNCDLRLRLNGAAAVWRRGIDAWVVNECVATAAVVVQAGLRISISRSGVRYRTEPRHLSAGREAFAGFRMFQIVERVSSIVLRPSGEREK